MQSMVSVGPPWSMCCKSWNCSDTLFVSDRAVFLFCGNNSHHHHHHHFGSFSGLPDDFLWVQCMFWTQCGRVHGSFGQVSKSNVLCVWIYPTGKENKRIRNVSQLSAEIALKVRFVVCTEIRQFTQSHMFNLFCAGGAKDLVLSADYEEQTERSEKICHCCEVKKSNLHVTV